MKNKEYVSQLITPDFAAAEQRKEKQSSQQNPVLLTATNLKRKTTSSQNSVVALNYQRNKKQSTFIRVVLKIVLIVIFLTPVFSNPSLIISGDNVKSQYVNIAGVNIYITELTGNPKIEYKDATLSSNKILLYGKDGDKAEAIGNVLLTDNKTKSKIKSKKAYYYKQTGKVEFIENPSVTSIRNDDNSVINIKADLLEYFIDENVAFAKGNVVLTNKDLILKSGNCELKRKENITKFTDNPVIYKGSDIYKADEIYYYTDIKKLVLSKNAQITTISEEKDSKTGEIKKEKMFICGETIENYDNEKLTVIKKGYIEKSESVFKGDLIEIKGEKAEDVKGSNVCIIFKEEKTEAYGEKFVSLKKENKSSLWGSPYLILRNNDNTEKSRIYGDFMEFYMDTDVLDISGNVKIIREKSIITGDLAKYKRASNDMYISGNPQIKEGDSKVSSNKIIYNTKTNAASLIGDIKGNAKLK